MEPNSITMTNKNKKYNKRSIFVALILLVAGLLCIILATLFDDIKLLSRDFWNFTFLGLGSTLLSVAFVTFLYDQLQRKHFFKSTVEAFSNVMDQKMPQRYINLRDAGITDAFIGLKVDSFCHRIKDLRDSEIRILKIFIPNLHTLHNALRSAIDDRNCTVKIILLSPNAKEAIEKRAQTLPLDDAKYITQEINQNIEKLKHLYSVIKNKDRVEVKLHNSFVSVSLIGYGARFWAGLYLRNRIATDGMFIKVQGETNSHYKELDQHFKAEWEAAESLDLGKRLV